MGSKDRYHAFSFVSLCELFCFKAIRRPVLKDEARQKTSGRLADRGHEKGPLRADSAFWAPALFLFGQSAN